MITTMGYDYGCKSSAESSDSVYIIISVQNVKPKVNTTKRPSAVKTFTGFKKSPGTSLSPKMNTGKKNIYNYL